MNWRKLILLILVIINFSIAFSLNDNESNQKEFLPLQQSVATSDNMMSIQMNPAFVGITNFNGFGWMHYSKDEKFKNHYKFLVNLKNLDYTYEKKENKVSKHNITIGSEFKNAPNFLQNMYMGSTYSWENSKITEPSYKTGLLYRPSNYSSFGIVSEKSYKETQNYIIGAGFRPFALSDFINPYRLDLSVDLSYNGFYAKEKQWNKPIFGISTEVINGLKIKGTYNMEDKGVQILFSTISLKSESGSIRYMRQKNQDYVSKSYGIDYILFTNKCFKDPLCKSPKKWYQVDTGKRLVTYKAPEFTIGPIKIFSDDVISIEELTEQIIKAKDDDTVQGLLFINKHFTSSLAIKQELISAIKEYKKTGKKVVFYYDNISNSEYVFASSIADKIYLNPNGSVDLKGISINSPYLKELLDKIGISVYNFRSHPTKTAGNTFSECSMTPEEKQSNESLISNLFNQTCKMIEEGRKDKLKLPIKQLIDEGPYLIAQEAYTVGLVDSLFYEDQLENVLKKDFGFKKTTKKVSENQDLNWYHNKKEKVAVVYTQGFITESDGEYGKVTAERKTVNLIRKARKDKSIKGIILRVDSNGGSAKASDIINHEIELARKENFKPVVVSMSGSAASGGYYISMNADKIFAQSGTLTGSIGVINITFTAENLFKKLAINWSLIKKGDNADFGSITRPINDLEKNKIAKSVENTYHQFVTKVAKGRKMSYDSVDQISQGKVWTGEQAKEIGLIDEIGGLTEAKLAMKDLLETDSDIDLINYYKEHSSHLTDFSIDAQPSRVSSKLSVELIDIFFKSYEKWLLLNLDSPLLIPEYDLDEFNH